MQLPDPKSAHIKDAYGEIEAVPEHLRATRIDVRCGSCGKLMALMITAPWRISCHRCKSINESSKL